MANIYLRTSKYVAAFMRSKGDGTSMPPSTPIEFSPYTQEWVVLCNGLRLVPDAQQHRASCYSQSAWQKMSKGVVPQGGLPILKRNPDDYLTYAEVCTLERLPNKTKVAAYEFLCIQTPREINLNNRVVRTNKSMTLDSGAAQQLRSLLRNTFIRVFLDFENRNKIFAQSKHINRTGIEVLERFFMEYDIPVSHDQTERETLRRLVQRWRQEAEYMVHGPSIVSDGMINRIDKHEIITV